MNTPARRNPPQPNRCGLRQTIYGHSSVFIAPFALAILLLLFTIASPPGSLAATKTWTGGGVLEKWDSGLNWDGTAPQPGDDLVFPANGNVGYQTDNNFPAGTSFRSITMTSQAIGQTDIKGWHHRGHAISLQKSMTFLTTGAFAPFSTINFPVTLADDVTFYLQADGAVWGSGFGDAVMDLADHTLTFQNAPVAGSGGIDFYDAIQGSGGLVVKAAQLGLYGPNTFSGPITVEAGGVLNLQNKLGLGSTAGLTTLKSGGTLSIGDHPIFLDSLSENITLAGGTVELEQLGFNGDQPAPLPFYGAWTVTTGGTINCEMNGAIINGVVGGTGNWTKKGTNTLQFAGSAANLFSGALNVNEGAVELNRSNGQAVTGEAVVNASGTLSWLLSDQFGPNGSLTVNDSGQALLNGHSDTVLNLNLEGVASLATGAGVLGVAGNLATQVGIPVNHAPTVTGTIKVIGSNIPHIWKIDDNGSFTTNGLTLNASVTVNTAGTKVRKQGSGTLNWTGTGSLAELEIDSGKVNYTGTGTVMNVVLNGGYFTGVGAVGNLTSLSAGGRLDAGFSGSRVLSCSNLLLNPATRFHVTLSTPTNSTEIRASHAVDLGGATFEPNVSNFFGQAVPGNQFVIVRNNSANPTTNTFLGLPEGSTLVLYTAQGRAAFSISYTNSGNDVVLTYFVPASGTNRLWTGAGANANWSTPQNWSNNIAPVAGDALTFPPGAARQVNTNDFAPGRAFDTILFTGGNYVCRGAAIGLNSGITVADGTVSMNLPITCLFDQTWQNLSAVGSLALSTNMDLGGHALTLEADVGLFVGINALGVISGAGHLIKDGPGQMQMTGTNTYTGPTTVAEGELILALGGRLGSSTGDTIVAPGAKLTFGGTTPMNLAETITLNGTLSSAGTNHSSTGFFTNNPGAIIEVKNNALTLFHMDGDGDLVKVGTGELILTGFQTNTYSGTTEIRSGTLTSAKDPNVRGLSGPITVGTDSSGATLNLRSNEQASATTDITLARYDAVLDTSNRTNTIGQLTLSGSTVVATGTGLLRFSNVTSLAASAPVSAVITGNVAQISAGFQDWLVEHTPGATNDLVLAATLTTPSLATPLKLGDGTLVVNGDFQANSIFIQEGTVLFNDTSTTAARLTGGTLGGTGTVGTLASFASGGVVTPGASTGILSSSNVTWNGSTVFAVELRTNTPGAGYDQLKVTGTVTLGNATLQVTALPGFSATNGTQFTIIDNDGADPITNTFASLPEGALVDAGNGVVLRVSYVGGTANDVVLTTVTTGVNRIWTGAGANSFWSTAANWSNSVAPQSGDSLIFSTNTSLRLQNTNDYPSGTAFGSIEVSRSGCSLNGAAITLHAGLSFNYNSASCTFAIPVTLGLPQTFSLDGGGSAVFSSAATIATAGNLLTLNVATQFMTLNGAISGSGGLQKINDGRAILAGSNSFSGLVTISEGELQVSHTNALGTTDSRTLIEPPARMRVGATLTGTITEDLRLGGSLVSDAANVTLAGNIEAKSGSAGLFSTAHTLTCAGALTGNGSLNKSGSGTLIIGGTATNSFIAGFSVLEGLVQLSKPDGVPALPSPLLAFGSPVTIGDGATNAELRLLTGNQIADAVPVTLVGDGALLNLNGQNETVSNLVFNGGDVETGAGSLHLLGGVTANSASNTAIINGTLSLDGAGAHDWNIGGGAVGPDLRVSGTLMGVGGPTLSKSGPGRLDLNAGLTVSNVTVTAGTLNANGNSPTVPFSVNGGTLGGTGIVGVVNASSGIVSPGLSPGLLNSSNVNLSASTVFAVELNGPIAGTGYDQLNVSGTVDLGGASLSASLGYTPNLGDAFTIIANDLTDSVSGTFNGLPDGAYFPLAGAAFQITYHGGGGNDVVLVHTKAPPATINSASRLPNGFAQIQGLGLAGLTYSVEAASNLNPVTVWTPIGTALANGSGSFSFTDTNAPSFPMRFYRVLSP